ncbi:MAG: hypothetical protein LBD92_07335 [Oscillospiraceae bacterium]|nr:hypothetical protein [Oscillospiraceae bacterium]
MALGKNARKRTFFSRESVDKALLTIGNIPVVGHIAETDDGKQYMGGHDVVVELTGEDIKIKHLTVPYGVVPGDNTFSYETVTEPDGAARDYLVGDVVLWMGRYPELKEAVYSDTTYFNQSMEIELFEVKPMDDGYFDVTSFGFSALCLLGKDDDKDSERHTEPAWPMARVDAYDASRGEEFTRLMRMFSDELDSCLAARETLKGGDNPTMKGGNKLTMKMSEDTDVTQTSGKEDAPEKMSFSAMTYGEKYTLLSDAVTALNDDKSDRWMWLTDFDDKYLHIGCSVNFEGATPPTNLARTSYKVDENLAVTLDTAFTPLYWKKLTAEEVTELESMQSRLDELIAYQSEHMASEKKLQVDKLLAQFSDLAKIDEFVKLREKAYDCDDMGQLELTCYAIRGKRVLPTQSGNERAAYGKLFLDSGDKDDDGDPYGELFERYGKN